MGITSEYNKNQAAFERKQHKKVTKQMEFVQLGQLFNQLSPQSPISIKTALFFGVLFLGHEVQAKRTLFSQSSTNPAKKSSGPAIASTRNHEKTSSVKQIENKPIPNVPLKTAAKCAVKGKKSPSFFNSIQKSAPTCSKKEIQDTNLESNTLSASQALSQSFKPEFSMASLHVNDDFAIAKILNQQNEREKIKSTFHPKIVDALQDKIGVDADDILALLTKHEAKILKIVDNGIVISVKFSKDFYSLNEGVKKITLFSGSLFYSELTIENGELFIPLNQYNFRDPISKIAKKLPSLKLKQLILEPINLPSLEKLKFEPTNLYSIFPWLEPGAINKRWDTSELGRKFTVMSNKLEEIKSSQYFDSNTIDTLQDKIGIDAGGIFEVLAKHEAKILNFVDGKIVISIKSSKDFYFLNESLKQITYNSVGDRRYELSIEDGELFIPTNKFKAHYYRSADTEAKTPMSKLLTSLHTSTFRNLRILNLREILEKTKEEHIKEVETLAAESGNITPAITISEEYNTSYAPKMGM